MLSVRLRMVFRVFEAGIGRYRPIVVAVHVEASGLEVTYETGLKLSLIHISEPTRLGMISYAVFCL